MDDLVLALAERGWVWVSRRFDDARVAFECARALIAARRATDRAAALELVGDFVLPPEGGGTTRDFQTLHFDFGVPIDPRTPVDTGRYTALHIPIGFGRVSAVTRLVPLAPLLGQRAWPSPSELLARFVAYGRTHGAWDDQRGYVEGSLARLVEAAEGSPRLPSVREPNFMCGTEFDDLLSELRFFDRHGLRVEEVQTEVPLAPGELLVFDNLGLAHGRRGMRRPGELRQWVFGERALAAAEQSEQRDRVIAAFKGKPGARNRSGPPENGQGGGGAAP